MDFLNTNIMTQPAYVHVHTHTRAHRHRRNISSRPATTVRCHHVCVISAPVRLKLRPYIADLRQPYNILYIMQAPFLQGKCSYMFVEIYFPLQTFVICLRVILMKMLYGNI